MHVYCAVILKRKTAINISRYCHEWLTDSQRTVSSETIIQIFTQVTEYFCLTESHVILLHFLEAYQPYKWYLVFYLSSHAAVLLSKGSDAQ